MSPDLTLLDRGGVVIWIIAALSVITVGIILWKVLHLTRLGVWGGQAAERALEGFQGNGTVPTEGRGGLRLKTVQVAARASTDQGLDQDAAREETERVARKLLVEARQGLRALEVIATVAPLLGLLGTVLGMITAFQALQESGARADASVLAGGIWEALLTTAAGMAVAIPAAVALAWFESVIERVAADMEDLATRVFIGRRKALARAAE